MTYGEEVMLTPDNVMDVLTHLSTTDSVFTNSECIFVEYYDILKTPWYILLTVIPQNEKLSHIMDFSDVKELNLISLLEWYCNRENRNFLEELSKVEPGAIDLDRLLDVLMGSEILYTANSELNTVEVIRLVLKKKLVKKVMVYAEPSHDKSVDLLQFIKKDVGELFYDNPLVSVVSGEFSEVLKQVPTDTTYFLSDINKVVTMSNEKRLDYASIVIPYDYAYNFVFENGKRTNMPLVNFDHLSKTNNFKLNFFNAIRG